MFTLVVCQHFTWFLAALPTSATVIQVAKKKKFLVAGFVNCCFKFLVSRDRPLPWPLYGGVFCCCLAKKDVFFNNNNNSRIDVIKSHDGLCVCAICILVAL